MSTSDDIAAMIEYWLATPANSKLGSNFGNNANTLISQPYNEAIANDFIKKLMTDLPVLQLMPKNSINIYAVERDFDKIDLFLEVSGNSFAIAAQ